MTKEKAIEVCAQAMSRISLPNAPDDYWKSEPRIKDMAEKLVAGLIALRVLHVTN